MPFLAAVAFVGAVTGNTAESGEPGTLSGLGATRVLSTKKMVVVPEKFPGNRFTEADL